MKPVFRCDYCSKIGTEEEIKAHEPVCTENYDRKSCYTCAHKHLDIKNGQWCYECKIGKKNPVGTIVEFCGSYERRKRDEWLNDLMNSVCGSCGFKKG